MKKVGNHSSVSRIFLLSLFFVFSAFVTLYAQEGDPAKGKALFNSNCAACHHLDKPMTGPALRGMTERLDRDWLHKWIRNSSEVIKSGDAYANKIFAEYKGSVMTPFPHLSDADIDDILAYTATEVSSNPPGNPENGPTVTTTADSSNELVLGVLIVVLLVLVTMLYMVNKGLKNIAQAKGVELIEEKKGPSLWQAFVKNQFLVLVSVIFLLLASAYFGYGYFMQVGVDKGYQPVQPIHYSHKIHAGDNGIDCKYCHSSARTSKTAGIPSLNVCMNCHENISDYNGEEDLEHGYTKAFYTAGIQRLYEAV